ncbi:MAG: hypothetical protein U0Y82_00650 [Thermoleophilia bacterium]
MGTATTPAGVAAAATLARPPGAAAGLRALVWRGLRDHRLTPLTWGGSLGALCALMAAMYPSMSDAIDRIMREYPRNLLKAFGVATIDSFESWLHAEMFSIIVPIAVAFLAARAATRWLVEAEQRGHLDTLLATPLARPVLVAGAFITTALVLVEVLAVVGALTYLVAVIAGAHPTLSVLLAGLVGVFALSLFFAGVAVLAAGFLHNAGAVTGVAAMLLGLMYTLNFVARTVPSVSGLRWASAFHYYGSPMIDGLDLVPTLGLVLVGLAMAAVGAVLFTRRDVLSR